VVWWLRQQRPQGQPYPFVLAAGKHGHLLEHFRTQLVRQPWHLHAAAALAASPRLEDREFARSKLHEPVIQTQMQRQLLAFVRSENLFWLTPFPSCPDQRWCGEHSWKLNLVARLRRDGAYPHLPAQELWDWYQSDARHEIAASRLVLCRRSAAYALPSAISRTGLEPDRVPPARAAFSRGDGGMEKRTSRGLGAPHGLFPARSGDRRGGALERGLRAGAGQREAAGVAG
jgi:hypothetical protein